MKIKALRLYKFFQREIFMRSRCFFCAELKKRLQLP